MTCIMLTLLPCSYMHTYIIFAFFSVRKVNSVGFLFPLVARKKKEIKTRLSFHEIIFGINAACVEWLRASHFNFHDPLKTIACTI